MYLGTTILLHCNKDADRIIYDEIFSSGNKKGIRMSKKDVFLIIVVVLGLTFLLTIGIPLLINLSYTLPITLIKTEWGAPELLDYYGTLLGVAVTVLTFAITVHLTLEQIRHQQNYEQKIKLWQETEDSIDQCLDAVHPMKLKYAFLETISKSESNKAIHLMSQIESYRINTLISADKLSRSLTRAYSEELKTLSDRITSMCQKLIPIADQYLQVFQEEVTNGNMNRIESAPNTIATQQNRFAGRIMHLDEQLQEIYDSDYLNLVEQKATLFRTKYDEFSLQKPKLFGKK